MSSLEDRIAAVLHKTMHRQAIDGRGVVTSELASAVVAELGLTQETQWGVRYDGGQVHTAIDEADARGWGAPAAEVLQRTVMSSVSPWRSASPEDDSSGWLESHAGDRRAQGGPDG